MSRRLFFTLSGLWFSQAMSLMKRAGRRLLSSIKPAGPVAAQVQYPGQGGYALVGVMVGAVIFFGGIMGIAGMHSQATRSNHDSLQRSQALWIAYEMTERIKSNFAGLDSVYQAEAALASTDIAAYCASPATQCSNGICSAAGIADFDVFEIVCGDGNLNRLVNPQIAIICPITCDSGDPVTVRISWDDRGAVAGALTGRQQVDMVFRRD